MNVRSALTIALALALGAGSTAAQHQHPDHKHEKMMQDGARAMGFDQLATTHHFRLATDGGAIEVQANDPSDTAIVGQVTKHLQTIRDEFARGDFNTPVAVHSELPAGADTLRKLGTAVTYTYEPMPGGGRVRLKGGSPAAVDAIHEFLRYQIREHRTGDSGTKPGR